MNPLCEVTLPRRDIESYRDLVGDAALDRFREEVRVFIEANRGRTIWQVNSTAAGGGVAEMLRSLLSYGANLQISLRWLVMEGDGEFFHITKRIHNGLHTSMGDGGPLAVMERDHYEKIAAVNLARLLQSVAPEDPVLLHDPQTAGMIPGLKKNGNPVVWRSHIGHEDHNNEFVSRSWEFLRPYLAQADRYVFTKEEYVPDWIDRTKVRLIHPSIDPFSAKNQGMERKRALSILHHIGLVAAQDYAHHPRTFTRLDGGTSKIQGYADVMGAGPLPTPDAPLVVQVSRWDRLKDMLGVMNGFCDYVVDHVDYHLALVGPTVHGVADDPEGVEAYQECEDCWRALPHFRRRRIRLLCLPMHDVEENGAMVNAIQTHASVIVQKSLMEGFGLTVTEAMWKGKPVVASGIGGIPDQITHGETGLLVRNPTDLEEFGRLLKELLEDEPLRARLGTEAKKKVLREFLHLRHLMECGELFRELR